MAGKTLIFPVDSLDNLFGSRYQAPSLKILSLSLWVFFQLLEIYLLEYRVKRIFRAGKD